MLPPGHRLTDSATQVEHSHYLSSINYAYHEDERTGLFIALFRQYNYWTAIHDITIDSDGFAGGIDERAVYGTSNVSVDNLDRYPMCKCVVTSKCPGFHDRWKKVTHIDTVSYINIVHVITLLIISDTLP